MLAVVVAVCTLGQQLQEQVDLVAVEQVLSQ
jgi:hypothetical protein